MKSALRLIIFCASLALLVPFATAQSTPEQTQTWLKDAKTTLARLDQPEAESQLPPGISPDALAERRRDVDQTVRTLNRLSGLREGLPDARAAASAARTAETDWSHFTEQPPFSLLLIDDLENRLAAAKERITTSRSSISLFQRSQENVATESSEAEDKARSIAESLKKTPDDPALKWQAAAAADKIRLTAARHSSFVANIDLLQAQIDAAQAESDLLRRQIKAASKSATLTTEDISKLQKTADDRIAALRKESQSVRARLRDAIVARNKAKEDLDATISGTPSPDKEADPLLTAVFETAEIRTEVLQLISDNLDSFASLEALTPEIYQKRLDYLSAGSRKERLETVQELRNYLERLNAWQTVSSNELTSVIADLGKQTSLSNLITDADPRVKTLAERREILWEKQQFLQRVSQASTFQQRNLSRWLDAFEEAERPKNWSTWLGDGWTKTKDFVRGIWTFELTKIPTANGQQGVELGLVISALTFFFIAYFVTGRLTRRLQSIAVNRGRIAEAQANTFRNWLMILAGIVLALTTLHILRIPLTVFAFFGGALAIGLGFGTQTLIKNFISGIIVLFERKVRVGDVIELDATTTGTITEINTRSSVLRNAEGKETLIPNALFLENRITNLTLSNRRVRRSVRLGVAHGSDTSQVITIMKECVERHGLILKEPSPLVTLDDINPGGMTFVVYFWTEFNNKTDSNIVSSDIRIMIDKRFSEAGISFQNSDVTLRADGPLPLEMVRQAPAPPPSPEQKRAIP
jgi:potassium efflux system protein